MSICNKYKSFNEPIYVTRPILPDLNELNDKLKEVWDSQWLTNNGTQSQSLELRLQEILKTPFLSLFNNGTIALIIACQSMRLSGDVITTPFTFPATPHVLTWNGIKPIFCDIDPTTMNIDANIIESMITPQTTAILGVHVFGTPCDVFKIQKIANKYGLKIVYDAAHAFGTEIDGVGIGNFGDISMFSFHATKLFHTAEGGALTFNDKNYVSRVNLLKNFGIKNEDEVAMPGINGKMNEIQAALGLLVLDLIEKEKMKRKALLEIYKECLKDIDGINIGNDMYNSAHSFKPNYQYCIIRINGKLFGKSRDYVYEEFKKFNVFTRKYFKPLCSDYYCYRQLPSSSADNLPISYRIKNEVLCMPLYGGLSTDEVVLICDILKNLH